MPRKVTQQARTTNLPPGTIVHVGQQRTEKIHLTVIDYNETELNEREAKNVQECLRFKNRKGPTWINISGIHDRKIIEEVGLAFGLHPLLLEDIANTEQRPKLEDFGTYLFVVMKVLRFDEHYEVYTEQISLVLGKNFVISFQERSTGLFEPIRERIRSGKGKMRKRGADYLAYSLIDTVVDSYFVMLERVGEKIEDIEEDLLKEPNQKTVQAIHRTKRQMIVMRRAVWPLREVISGMGRGGSKVIQEGTAIYLRDAYDHTIQVIDTVETFRDMLSGMLDLYLSSISNRMNEVMKVLTVIATIFIPLTFITGIYGMNFEHMPELKWIWGYPFVLSIMAIAAGGMLWYFWRKKWV